MRKQKRFYMVMSMTGFGRGEAPLGDGTVVVEITAVNGRYLETTVRGLRDYGALEMEARSRVAERLGRGNVAVKVNFVGSTPAARSVVADVELARAYEREFDRMRAALGLRGALPLEALANQQAILAIVEKPGDEGAAAGAVRSALDLALDGLLKMRAAEGDKLKTDLQTRLGALGDALRGVAERAPAAVAAYAEKLRERVAGLAADVTVDDNRMEAEVTLFAERSDITEELVRGRAHAEAFAKTLAEDGRVGRRLDFLIVEMNREINTVAAKTQDADIAAAVIEIKNLLEQLREQVQNIE